MRSPRALLALLAVLTAGGVAVWLSTTSDGGAGGAGEVSSAADDHAPVPGARSTGTPSGLPAAQDEGQPDTPALEPSVAAGAMSDTVEPPTDRSASTGSETASVPARAAAGESNGAEIASPPSDSAVSGRDSPGESPGGESTLGRIAAMYTPNDLQLLSEVQYHLDGPAPPELTRLLEIRREGADIAVLESYIDAELDDPVVRVAARRWLRRIAGESEPAHPRLGTGGGAPHLRPIRRR